ncbi:MAG: hypothetical protein V4654_12285 [Bdellovibrionota bacterium]
MKTSTILANLLLTFLSAFALEDRNNRFFSLSLDGKAIPSFLMSILLKLVGG